jgi:high affinity sulfate transporter 1
VPRFRNREDAQLNSDPVSNDIKADSAATEGKPVAAPTRGWSARLAYIAPGLPVLVHYRRSDFPHDLMAGLSVAAVALPVGVAYAQLAGFGPEVGLYASILPLVAYALFGTSRQLVIGPDAATCALVAAAVAPLAAGDPALYLSLSVTLAFITGMLCIAASFLKLGGLADFLSRPILVGFMNGIALSIVLGQIGKLLGFAVEAGRIVPRLLEVISKLGLTHWPTLAVGLASFAVLAIAPRIVPRLPAALVTMAAAALAVGLLDLDSAGVSVIGEVPAGLPRLHLPVFPPGLLPELLSDAAGIALIAFTSMVLTARSFAIKNGYDIDVDRELAALGTANVASALSQGFAVSGADSRTAMNDAAGGRTQVAGLVAAGAIAAVLLFLTGPLRYVPIAALGAVLVKAALSLVDIRALRTLLRIDRRELALSVIVTLGVVAFGAVQAILLAVVLALLRFVRLVSRPEVDILGKVPGFPGFHALSRHPDAATSEGLVLLRFNAPIVFFNAPQFKRAALDAAHPGTRWLVVDMLPVTMIDATGLLTVVDLIGELKKKGIALVAAGRKTQWHHWAQSHGVSIDEDLLRFPTLRQAVKAYNALLQPEVPQGVEESR